MIDRPKPMYPITDADIERVMQILKDADLDMLSEQHQDRSHVAEYIVQLAAAEARLERIIVEHEKIDPGWGFTRCKSCDVVWPCPTIQAIDAEGEG